MEMATVASNLACIGKVTMSRASSMASPFFYHARQRNGIKSGFGMDFAGRMEVADKLQKERERKRSESLSLQSH